MVGLVVFVASTWRAQRASERRELELTGTSGGLLLVCEVAERSEEKTSCPTARPQTGETTSGPSSSKPGPMPCWTVDRSQAGFSTGANRYVFTL